MKYNILSVEQDSDIPLKDEWQCILHIIKKQRSMIRANFLTKFACKDTTYVTLGINESYM